MRCPICNLILLTSATVDADSTLSCNLQPGCFSPDDAHKIAHPYPNPINIRRCQQGRIQTAKAPRILWLLITLVRYPYSILISYFWFLFEIVLNPSLMLTSMLICFHFKVIYERTDLNKPLPAGLFEDIKTWVSSQVAQLWEQDWVLFTSWGIGRPEYTEYQQR